MMYDLAIWLAVAYAIWLAAIPFAWLALGNLHDRGAALARPLGLLAIGSAVWLVSLIGIAPSIGAIWWSLLVAIALVGWTYVIWTSREEFGAFLRQHWRDVLVAELVFLAAFAAFAALKANDPDIAGTEKPMDLTMLNAMVSDQYAPPADLWLSGFDVAYYYFGYWLFGGISQMSGIAPSIAYNLSLALIAGMAATCIYSLVAGFIRKDGGSTVRAMLGGGVSVGLLLVVSNLNGLWELLALLGVGENAFFDWLAIDGVDASSSGDGWRPTGFWWWWASSRVINTFGPYGEHLDFTIQEFPFFSFLLGDLHPHVMSIPFVLLALAMSVNLLWSRVRWGWSWLSEHRAAVLGIVLMIGAAGFINAWDVIVVLPVMAAAVLMKSYRENGYRLAAAIRIATLPLAALVGLAIILYSNFYFGTLESQVGFPPVAPTRYGTRLIHLTTVWLPLFAVSSVFVYGYVVQGMRRGRLATVLARVSRPSGASLIWLLPLSACVFVYVAWAVTHVIFNDNFRWLHLAERLPVSVLTGALFIVLAGTLLVRARRGSSDAAQMSLLIAAVAMFYIFFAEHFYALDFFATRMNTVFKLYYQAWIILSVVGGYGIYHWLRVHPRLVGKAQIWSSAGAVLVVLLMAVGCYYAVAASVTKTSETSTRVTFDGLAFMESRSPDRLDAINWIRLNLGSDSILVESVGGGYSEYGRYSGFSGVPGVLGWTGHERQWRGGDAGWSEREGDVRRIYELSDLAEVRTLIAQYGVTHVVVSDLEREKYTEIDATKFAHIGSLAYSNARVEIYDVRR